MQQLTKNMLYVAFTALLGLVWVYLMFDVKPNASSVSGVIVGGVVARLTSLWLQSRRAVRRT